MVRSASDRSRVTWWYVLLPWMSALAAGCEIIAGIPDVADGRDTTGPEPDAGACPVLDTDAGKEGCGEGKASCGDMDDCATDLSSDEGNCGACGHDCRGGECDGGKCSPVELFEADTPVGLALHGGTLYWTEQGAVVGFSTASNAKVASWSSISPEEVVADESGVYWSQTYVGCLHRGPLDGGTPIEIGKCTGTNGGQLALDETHVYWVVATRSGECGDGNPCCGSGNTGCILRARKDGQDVLPYAQDEVGPLAVTVDASHVYWSDMDPAHDPPTGRVKRCPKEGCAGEPEIYLELPANGLGQLSRMAIDGEYLYWLDRGKARVQRVRMTAQDRPSAVELVAEGPFYGSGLLVDDTHVYWSAGTSIWRRSKLLEKESEAERLGGAQAHSIAVDCLHVYWTEMSQEPEGAVIRLAR